MQAADFQSGKSVAKQTITIELIHKPKLLIFYRVRNSLMFY
jgi:hypothetical protein